MCVVGGGKLNSVASNRVFLYNYYNMVIINFINTMIQNNFFDFFLEFRAFDGIEDRDSRFEIDSNFEIKVKREEFFQIPKFQKPPSVFQKWENIL